MGLCYRNFALSQALYRIDIDFFGKFACFFTFYSHKTRTKKGAIASQKLGYNA